MMSDPFKFELVSPARLLVSGEVEQVIVPGSEGEMTVLAYHAPLLATLKPGLLEIGFPGGERQRYFAAASPRSLPPALPFSPRRPSTSTSSMPTSSPRRSRTPRRTWLMRPGTTPATEPRPSSTSSGKCRPRSTYNPVSLPSASASPCYPTFRRSACSAISRA